MTSVNLSSTRQERVSLPRLLRAAAIAAAVAVLGNMAVFYLSTALGVSFVFPLGGAGSAPEQLPVFMVIAASIGPAFAAAVFVAILAHFVARPFRIFTIVAIVLGLLSLAGPFSMSVALATKLALSAMHIVAGVAIVSVLTGLGREK